VWNDAPMLHGKVIRQISYKEGHRLDIYLPTEQKHKKNAVIVFFHGGAWVSGVKEAVNFNRINEAINVLRANGYAIVSPNYSLATREKSPFPDCINDAFDALAWVKENAELYNFDLHNVGLFGESAGAHIALMAAYAKPIDFSDSIRHLPNINYVIDIYGPTDLEKIYHMQSIEKINKRIKKLPKNIRKHIDISQQLYGFDPEKDSIKSLFFQKKYSPINYINANSPPTLIIHGKEDQIVPVDQSNYLKKELDSLKIESQIHIIDGVNHAFRGINRDSKDNVQIWITEFIMKHYRDKKP